MKFVFVQPVFLDQLRSAAVGTDAVLAVVQAEHGTSALLQLIMVSLIRQLFLCIHGSVEGEGLTAHCCERCFSLRQKVACIAAEGHIVTVVVAAVFLGTDLILVKVRYRRRELPVKGGEQSQ